MSSANSHNSNTDLAAGIILQERYRVVRPLGKGGMGAVYEALDLRLDTTVALKETFSTDDQLRKQFEREARMLAHLRHPSLPRVTDYFTEGDRAFLVMEFIEGVDLAKIIVQQPGPFPLASVVAWADQLLDALTYLHSRDRQVIHRDIKPHNLKLRPQGQIALLDFGLAKAHQQNTGGATSSAAIHGYTKQYAPLEQIQDLATGPQCDIYALGATLYHLLTGLKPPDALTRAGALVQSRPDPLLPANQVHPAIGPEIAAILMRAMAQSPEDRYASASDFRDALRRVGRSTAHIQAAARPVAVLEPAASEITCPHLSDASRPQPEDPGSLPSGEGSKRYRILAVAAAIVLLLTVSVPILLRSDSKTKPTPAPLPASPNVDLASTSIRASKPVRPGTHKNEVDATSSSVAAGNAGTGRFAKEAVAVATSPAQANSAKPTRAGNVAEPAPAPQVRHAAIGTAREPKIYLPNSDLLRNAQPPVPASLPMSEPRPISKSAETTRATPTEEPRQPQVLRARDGTQIVRFPDGSTRVYRPGERISHSSNVPQ